MLNFWSIIVIFPIEKSVSSALAINNSLCGGDGILIVLTCTHLTIILTDHNRLRKGYLKKIMNTAEIMFLFRLSREICTCLAY